jgi:uncharacterized membrane protein YeaQ/YmgE (transglycosylase-associated protein family)
MHLIWFAIVGLVAGFLAKMIMPGGRGEPSGWFMTMLLGLAGSFVVGLILHGVLGWRTSGGMAGTILGATIGACALIWVANLVRRN